MNHERHHEHDTELTGTGQQDVAETANGVAREGRDSGDGASLPPDGSADPVSVSEHFPGGNEGDAILEEKQGACRQWRRFGDGEFDLSTRQRLFVEEYLLDCNATKAAIRAGYSPRTAKKAGPRLLTNPRIRAAIRMRMQERSERTRVSADYVIERLVREAEGEGEDSSPMARVKALELLGRHLGMFWERREVVEPVRVVYVEATSSSEKMKRDSDTPADSSG